MHKNVIILNKSKYTIQCLAHIEGTPLLILTYILDLYFQKVDTLKKIKFKK